MIVPHLGTWEKRMLRLALTAVLLLAIRPALAAEAAYYNLPEGSYPHDVAPAADGPVWFTGQHQGFLGRFDPKTGSVEKVPLGRGAAPHGVIVAPDGGAWVTEGGQNAIARVDPATRAVKLFPLPKEFPNANLNTPTIGRNGIVWFTGQSGVYGRLDPASGKVDAWKAPRGTGPYGIAATPAGEVWFASLAGDYIGRIEPATGAVTVVDPPRRGAGPRRVWSDSKGVLWVSFWQTGEVARYDPASKVWKTWQLPGSKSGAYAVYVDDKDRVWLTDFSANAIVRFEPESEKFTSFPSDRRGASVRQLLGRVGEVWGGESGTDRLVVVRD
jgi:virginiamycin B lyase